MKARTSFVSNSSSASFVLNKGLMTQKQIEAIRNHIEYAKWELEFVPFVYQGYDMSFPWDVDEPEATNTMHVSTSMDNFDMQWFLEQIGVSEEAIISRGD
jgi:hypothetical protein